jgi:hypothetical protein
MARNRGKKALYEVMSKARVKPGSGKAIEPLHSKKTQEVVPADDTVVEKTEVATQWWRKPRIVQYHAGRLEFSISYQLAITLVLILLLLLVIAYGLGQRSYAAKQRAAQSAPATQNNNQDNPIRQTAGGNIRPAGNTVSRQPINPDATPAKSTGSNVIVLKEYHALADLLPVQQFFNRHLIITEIVPRNNRYFLQTVDKYDNPARPGTDGYKARQKIVEIGKQYRAPESLESFAPNYFDDAYGKKVE